MASRETLRILCNQWKARREIAARGWRSLALGGYGGQAMGGLAVADSGREGLRCGRNSSSLSSQLEVSIAASDPAPGFPSLSGLSTPSTFKPLAPPAPSRIENLDEAGLAREMSHALSHQKMEEAVRLYDEWTRSTDANQPGILVYNLLLHAKLRLGVHPDAMFRIVSEMEKAGVVPTQLSFNFLLRSVFRQRDSKSAEQILGKMERAGPAAQPDGDAYNFVIALCALNRRIPAALKHLQAMYSRSFVPSKTTYNEVLLACARVHRTQEAVAVLKQLEAHQIVPHTQTLVELVIAATEVDDAECALMALQHLNRSGPASAVQPLVMDEGSVVTVLGTAARASSAALAKEAWELLKLAARGPSPAAYMALVHALSSSRQFDEAFLALVEMERLFGSPEAGEEVEVLSPFSSLRPLVLALSQLGPTGLDGAYFKLAEMHANAQPVPLAAINCVILGCANIWDTNRAYQTFESINGTFGLRPDVHSINALLEAFGKTRKIVEAVKLFEYMRESGVTPDRRSFALMITAHVVNRDVQSASAMLTAMMDAGHNPYGEVLYKLWRRCRREGDSKTAAHVRELLKKWDYRDPMSAEGRRRVIGTTAKQFQSQPLQAS